MLIPSHAVLAKYVNDYLEANYGTRLNAAALYYGSIAPDLFDKDKGSHYSSACLANMRKLLKQIEVVEDGKAFCHLLGEMLHYVADYFTAAHNKPYMMKNMRLHMMYETQLHLLLIKEKISSATMECPTFNGDLMAQLEAWHDIYVLARSKASHDLSYIMRCSFLVASVLVEKHLHLLMPESVIAIA